MQYRIIIALLTGMVSGMTGQVVAGELLLDSYLWEHRVVLICAVSPHDKRTAVLDGALEVRRSEVRDRDLVIVRAYEDGTGFNDSSPLAPDAVRQLREEFSISTGDCVTVLIGKDGTEKLRTTCTVELEDIFAVVDAMPMRQREIRERGVEVR